MSGLECDILLIATTTTEWEMLKSYAMKMFSISNYKSRKKKSITGLSYFDIGKFGNEKIFAIKLERMGSISFRTSPFQGMVSKIETGLSSIVLLGMGFGVDLKTQTFGDVMVSKEIVTYDNRFISDGEDYLYSLGEMRRNITFSSSDIMLNAFYNFHSENSSSLKYKVQFGSILSGNARISCPAIRDNIISKVDPYTNSLILGGDMEAAGLVGLNHPDEPISIVVKGISDFAGNDSLEEVIAKREQACYNSIDFVFKALKYAYEQ